MSKNFIYYVHVPNYKFLMFFRIVLLTHKKGAGMGSVDRGVTHPDPPRCFVLQRRGPRKVGYCVSLLIGVSCA